MSPRKPNPKNVIDVSLSTTEVVSPITAGVQSDQEGEPSSIALLADEPPVKLVSSFSTLEMVIPVKYIESVNKLNTGVVRYTSTKDKVTGKMYNKPVPGVMLTPEARAAMHDYFSQLEKYVPKYALPKTSYANLDITYGFYIGANTFRRRDNDNMLKIFQDCLSHHLGFNDNQIITIHTYKRCLDPRSRDSHQEYVYVKIKNLSKSDEDLIVTERSLKDRVGYKFT